ncbi:MAG: TolC family protein [Gallionellaceae bacterium]|nr:TolC family protein [Gallionellaceae bacterium]
MSCPKCQGHGKRRWPLVIVVLAAILVATAVFAADPPPLKLGDAAVLAATRQPLLEAQAAAIDALESSAVANGQWPDPKLRVGVASLPLDTFSFIQEPMTQATVGVSQAIPGGDKARLAGARSDRETEQARRQLDASRQRIGRDAGLAWLTAWWPEAAAPLVRQIGQEWDRQIEWAEVAYTTDKLAQDEVVALRGMMQATLDRMDELERQRQRSRAALARWVGEAAAQPLADLDAIADLPPLADLEARIDRHPELAVLAGAVAVARAEVDQAREAYKPDLSLDIGYGLRGGGRPDFISVGVGMDLPLFTANRQDRRLAAKEAKVTQAEQMLADRRLTLRAELDEDWAEWQAAGKRIERYEHDILPLARQRVASALNAYGSNRATFGRVSEARRAELEARINLLGQRVALAKARVQIDYLTAESRP